MIDETDYVGKTLAEARMTAQARGLSVRITMVDEVETMSTSELRRDRVNFKISGDMVTGAYPG